MPSKQPPPDAPALVLSGGGLRLSFQVGALRYLYLVESLEPRTFVGTSAGSLLASVLAQSDTREDQMKALDHFVDVFTGFKSISDVLKPTPEGAPLLEPLRQAGELVDPTRTALALALLSGHVDAAEAQPVKCIFTPGSILDYATTTPFLDAEKIQAAGNKLRVTVVGLESGKLRYVAEDGSIRNRRDEVIAPAGSADVGKAILASCALPGVFPPILIAGEHYLDGGMREFLPAAAALDNLECGPVYAITTRPAGLRRTESFQGRGLLSFIARAHGDIAEDEIVRDELNYAAARGARLITSQTIVHEVFEFIPPLFRISAEDGWMMAAARHRSEGDPSLARSLRDAAAAITSLRVQLVRHPQDADATRDALRRTLDAAPQAILPPTAVSWTEPDADAEAAK